MTKKDVEDIVSENTKLKNELKELKKVGIRVYSMVFWMEYIRGGNESINKFKELLFKKED